MEHLRKVFVLLKEHSLLAKQSKCNFGEDKLRGFLGPMGYYIRFVKNYGSISQLITDLLRKDSFLWIEAAFEKLKKAMTSTLVLALPNVSREFVVK
ncbi:uncharacterized protein LOC116188832 [Punica granatum]|uniref:Uncharacterized protein LOC116188832 n=1 Tax=Punica granatum TaxID=22663 RepID=A0A6P8BTF3_PUNGR|nr:uncharacterized protein LOC116188832 [Punica granatum]